MDRDSILNTHLFLVDYSLWKRALASGQCREGEVLPDPPPEELVQEPRSGEIRTLPNGRRIFLAQELSNQKWLAVPVSRFQHPATEREILIQITEEASMVLELWNVIIVTGEDIRHSSLWDQPEEGWRAAAVSSLQDVLNGEDPKSDILGESPEHGAMPSPVFTPDEFRIVGGYVYEEWKEFLSLDWTFKSETGA